MVFLFLFLKNIFFTCLCDPCSAIFWNAWFLNKSNQGPHREPLHLPNIMSFTRGCQFLLRSAGGAGVDPSWLQVKGAAHPGQVVSLTFQEQKPDKKTCNDCNKLPISSKESSDEWRKSDLRVHISCGSFFFFGLLFFKLGAAKHDTEQPGEFILLTHMKPDFSASHPLDQTPVWFHHCSLLPGSFILFHPLHWILPFLGLKNSRSPGFREGRHKMVQRLNFTISHGCSHTTAIVLCFHIKILWTCWTQVCGAGKWFDPKLKTPLFSQPGSGSCCCRQHKFTFCYRRPWGEWFCLLPYQNKLTGLMPHVSVCLQVLQLHSSPLNYHMCECECEWLYVGLANRPGFIPSLGWCGGRQPSNDP